MACIEFVPGHPELFVVGTYYLEKKDQIDEESTATSHGQPQQRTGSLLLFKLDGDEVTLQHELPTPFAIFDIHFAPASHNAPLLLGAATSTGSLALYRVSPTETTLLNVLQLFPTTSLITYFTWHPLIPGIAGLALSDGNIYLCDTQTLTTSTTEPTDPGDSTSTITLLHSHSLEAWFTAFTPTGTSLLTGGDDSLLACTTLPTITPTTGQALLAAASESPPPIQWQDRKTHFAGVTAILPLTSPADEDDGDARRPLLLLTGSYDDHIRLFSLPSSTSFPRRPTLLAELNLGGGVWRLKDITTATTTPRARRTEFTILASCMHAGARILRLEGAGDAREGELAWEFEVLAKFEEHQSMNYGSDVQQGSDGRKVVSTSFYDRLLAVWKW
ncbi:Prohibitin-2, subunit of the prohibitin complex (Phb1p-Phb2p) [Botryosphaeria dothidea]